MDLYTNMFLVILSVDDPLGGGSLGGGGGGHKCFTTPVVKFWIHGCGEASIFKPLG